eukprot:scaffold1766_cov39-Attheya_sp.AAC.1
MVFLSGHSGLMCPFLPQQQQKSLDWCSGKDSACIGFGRAYRICPTNVAQTKPPSAIPVGVLVQSPMADSQSVSWVMRLPSKKKRGYHVRHANGTTERMSEEEVANCRVESSSVSDQEAVESV